MRHIPPNILIVNFKRFDTLVDFPIEGLDIGKYVVNEDKKKESVYALFAIVIILVRLALVIIMRMRRIILRESDLSLMIILCLKLMNQVG